MAQGAIISITDNRPRYSMAVYRIDWTAAANGSFTMALDMPMFGSIMHFVTKPGATAPTDLSDVTLTDQHGFDVFNGLGTDKVDATDTLQTAVMTEATIAAVKYGVNPSIACMNPTLTILNNSVDSAKGTIWIYLR